jgi:alanyl-tRNA synthetase
MTSVEIRQQFLDFFKTRGHDIVPSAPIVIKNDPTLMFTNAGMNQFKEYFLGNKAAPFKRAADTQKCLRVSGKHNDLEEVGVDTYHHTMFEMLGNWSFGDYFKPDAIKWSWELLTSVYKIPTDRLYVTIFAGDEKEKLPRDEEAFTEWSKWIEEDRILLFGKKDNFWEMGDTGPCGPCTEIHVDTRQDDDRKKMNGRDLVNRDNPQVIEIWNNVFIEFNRLKNGSLESLPSKHVDTGMGLERLVRVLQSKQSNYDTDLFMPLINEIEKITGQKYEGTATKKDVAFRVLADHVRAIAFTIADGQLPSNVGAGYVIRRILRRAVTYYNSYLGYKMKPLLHELVPTLAREFENVFPELHKQEDFVKRVINEEEESFLQTLYLGMAIFNSYMNTGIRAIEENREHSISLGNKKFPVLPRKAISGEFAFELKDTYGFPIDLTSLIASELGWKVDMEGFEESLGQQKDRSRAATAIETEDWVVLAASPGKENLPTKFVGYDSLESQTKVTRYRKIKMKGKEAVQIVLEETPFYAESGGQVGDTGHLSFEGERVSVLDTKRENDLIVHYTDRLPVNIAGVVTAQVNIECRKKTAVHHSATHLLHAALRAVLGTHVAQKGSLVNAEHLRFDFSHFSKMTDEEILKVEQMVNEKIRENIPVVIKLLPKDEAMKIGAMALFGEKYGEVVRVVVIDPTYSIELCGGTHVGATGELGIFKILHESAVAAGVRRIEALCGEAAEYFIHEQLSSLRSIRETLKQPNDITKAVENLLQENIDARKQIEKQEGRQLLLLKDELIKRKTQLDGINFIGEIVEVNSADALKKLCFDLKNELKNYVVVLAANIGGKPQVAVMLDEAVSKTKNLEAPKIIKEQIAPLIKGGGGGQKTLATAGGQDASNLKQVIEEVRQLFV